MKNDIPWSDEDTNVAHLTGDDFEEYVQQHNSVLVMFYAPCKSSDFFFTNPFCSLYLKKMHFYLSLLGCGHCKKAKPEFETAAGTVNTDEVYRLLGACLTTADKGSGKKRFYPNYSNTSYCHAR